MKKLISLFLVVILAFSMAGCAKKEENPFTTTGEVGGYTYPRFMQTDWGMTPEEAIAALGMTESDFKIETAEELFPEIKSDSRSIYYEGFISLNGEDAMFSLEFINETNQNGDPILGLIVAKIALSNQENIALANEAVSAFEQRKAKAKITSHLDFFEANNLTEIYYDKIGYLRNVEEEKREKVIKSLNQDFKKRGLFNFQVIEATVKDDLKILEYSGRAIAAINYCYK